MPAGCGGAPHRGRARGTRPCRRAGGGGVAGVKVEDGGVGSLHVRPCPSTHAEPRVTGKTTRTPARLASPPPTVPTHHDHPGGGGGGCSVPDPNPQRRGQGGPEEGGGLFFLVSWAFLNSLFHSEHFEHIQTGGYNPLDHSQ